ncbi:MFS transporter [Clostridia bacterium]|nr:MFS transporter [Clostridia bacterium]
MQDKGRRRRFSLSAHLFDSTGMSETLSRSLFYVILSVAFGAVYSVVTTGAAWTGFVRKLGADSFTLGMLTAIPLAASAVQIFIAYLIERTGKRRQLFIWGGIIGRSLWAPIGIIPYIIPMSNEALRMASLMIVVGVCSCSNAIINVGFYSLVSDIVPMHIRGRYFASRSTLSLIASVITGILVSQLIDRTSGYTGYTIALIVAGIFGAVDICCYLRVKWPQMKLPESKPTPLVTMVRAVFRHKQFRTIMFIMTYYGFAVNLGAPFYNVYMLEVVKMTYTQVTLINQVLPNIIAVFIISWWGRRMDSFGNKPVLNATGLFMMIYPLLWMFSGVGSFFMIIVLNIFTGMLSNAFDLSNQNLYMNAAPDTNRSMFISVYFAVTQLLGNALGNLTGGWLLENTLPTLESLRLTLIVFPMTRYHFLFALSAIMRISMIFFMLPLIREENAEPMGVMLKTSANEIIQSSRRVSAMVQKEIKRMRARRTLKRFEQGKIKP